MGSPNPTAAISTATSTASPTSTATTLVTLSTSGNATAQSTPHKPPRHRGTRACRRCRRLRNKCIHSQGQTPCQGCIAAGPDTADSCAFPARGERDVDREFRRRPRPQARVSLPQQSVSVVSSRPTHLQLPSRLPPPGVEHGAWPPHDEVVDGCRTFVTCYFQLGFLPRSLFLERLVQSPEESDNGSGRFLLSCLLAISSRFTPCLVQRYGSRTAATDHFLGLAQAQALAEMYAPSLERTQAFFLLSIAEWGNSDRDRSAIDMAVALRMALLLRLHKEETYAVAGTPSSSSPATATPTAGTPKPRAGTTTTGATPQASGSASVRASAITPTMNSSAPTPRPSPAPSPADSLGASAATADHVVRLESARRTLWMIYSQENLHSGTSSPAPLSLEDTTALLPCNEADFSFGAVPAFRAALEGTPPAHDNPALAVHPDRCLFATLIQAHSLWGRVARHATRSSLGSNGGVTRPGSTYGAITDALRRWEATLPPRHRWSLWNLRGWRSEGLHLAYLSVVMVLRLSNIVIRRVYLEEMIAALGPQSPVATTNSASPPMPAPPPALPAPSWQRISYELFDNVVELHEQVTAYFSMRTPDEGFPAILVFCVYMCGSLASYLWHNPYLCPHVSPVEAEEMALGTLRILSELYTAWPASARWEEVLRRVAGPESGETESAGTAAVGEETETTTAVDIPVAASAMAMAIDLPQRPLPLTTQDAAAPLLSVPTDNNNTDSRSHSVVSGSGRSSTAGSEQDDLRPLIITDFPSDLFNAELADYLNGTIHYGLLDGLY